jgi:hypothetical protein
MFFDAPGKPTKLKKNVYLLASIILGLLLSFIVHAVIEINYLNWIAGRGEIATFYGRCALVPWLRNILWICGAVGGYFMGQFWWRKVYVERVWAKRCSLRKRKK